MRQVTREEAVANIAELLDAAEQGEEVVVTRAGRPAVRFNPVAPGPVSAAGGPRLLSEAEAAEVLAHVARTREAMFREGFKPLSLEEIREFIDEGRR